MRPAFSNCRTEAFTSGIGLAKAGPLLLLLRPFFFSFFSTLARISFPSRIVVLRVSYSGPGSLISPVAPDAIFFSS